MKVNRELDTGSMRYDPFLCKTCQALKSARPRVARFRFSDCDKHFKRRMKNMIRCGGVFFI